jgi:hypothetical protein
MKNNLFKIEEFYCCLIEIKDKPFVVFSITDNFDNGMIQIYSLYRESIITAYQEFKEIVKEFNDLKKLN